MIKPCYLAWRTTFGFRMAADISAMTKGCSRLPSPKAIYRDSCAIALRSSPRSTAKRISFWLAWGYSKRTFEKWAALPALGATIMHDRVEHREPHLVMTERLPEGPDTGPMLLIGGQALANPAQKYSPRRFSRRVCASP